MSARLDMLAGLALAGLCAQPHTGADLHPLTGNAAALAARAAELGRALDAALGQDAAQESPADPIGPEPQKKKR